MATAFLLAACAQPQVEGESVLTGTNPIITGQFTADPTARVFEGKIYMYPSHDIPSVITHTDGSAWFINRSNPLFFSVAEDNTMTEGSYMDNLEGKDIVYIADNYLVHAIFYTE